MTTQPHRGGGHHQQMGPPEPTFGTNQLIHMGIEVIVIGGVTYWLYQKNKALSEKIDELTAKMDQLHQILNHQGQLINKHENALNNMFDPQPQQRMMPGYQGMTPPVQPQYVQQPQQSKKNKKKSKQVIESSEDSSEDEEFSTMLAEVSNGSACEGDTCDLIPTKKKSSKRVKGG